MDTLNNRLIFASDNDFGIPTLAPCTFEPSMLAAWHDPKQRAEARNTGGALHFFLDDYRFEKVWSRPEAAYDRIADVGAALSPDFSMWRTMPVAAQLWQVYRSRWCAAFWQHLGVDVVPTVSWGAPNTYHFAFLGLPQNACVAISSVGVRKDGRKFFEQGVAAMIDACKPKLILCYGKPRIEIGCATREYPTYWDARRK